MVKCEDGKLIITSDTTRLELMEAEKAFYGRGNQEAAVKEGISCKIRDREMCRIRNVISLQIKSQG